jgi:hypothetical protein
MAKVYSQDELQALKERNEDWLMSQPGVTGTGIGLTASGDVALRIFTTRITDSTRAAIRSRLPEDAPIDWDEGEEIVADTASSSPRR